ncbi:MAG: histidine kinase N-terminal 7TM domain-containing protein [Patescibacteria group bacterium]
MITVLIYLTYIIAIGELFLAGYFWKTNSNNPIRRTMAFLTLTTGLWVLSTALTVYQNFNQFTYFTSTILFVFGILSLTALFHFAIVYPVPIFNFNRIHKFLLYSPAFIFSLLILFTHTVIKGSILSHDYYGSTIPGPVFPVYNCYLLLLYLLTLILLYIKIRRNLTQRSNINIVFWSLLISGIPTVIFDLIFPSFFHLNPNPLIGVLLNFVWMGSILYILLKK